MYFKNLWEKYKNKNKTLHVMKNKIREHHRSIQSKKSAAIAATDSLDFPQLDLDRSEFEEAGSEIDSEAEVTVFFCKEVHKRNMCCYYHVPFCS